jgi:hypothetical protein
MANNFRLEVEACKAAVVMGKRSYFGKNDLSFSTANLTAEGQHQKELEVCRLVFSERSKSLLITSSLENSLPIRRLAVEGLRVVFIVERKIFQKVNLLNFFGCWITGDIVLVGAIDFLIEIFTIFYVLTIMLF